MRNLKQSYRSLKDNNKKSSTGSGTISWEWYEIMEDIFREDKTINIDSTLSSMTYLGGQNLKQQPYSGGQNLKQQATSSTSFIYDVKERNSSSDSEIIENVENGSFTDNDPSSSLTDAASEPMKNIRKQKAAKSKNLYYMRKKESDLNEKRLDTLNGIKQALDDLNDVQKQRNKMFEKMLLALTAKNNFSMNNNE